MSSSGYIKLHRKFIEWELYFNPVAKTVFLHILLKANWKDKVWKGRMIKRGQYVTSIRKLATDVRHTERQTRSALSALKKSKVIDTQSNTQFTLITINKFDTYQSKDNAGDTQNDTVNDTRKKVKATHETTHKVSTTKEERNKEPPIVPQGDGEGSIKKSDWNAFCKHFLIDRIPLTPDLTDEVIAHLLSVLREQSQGAKIRVPLAVAKKRAEEGEAERQDKRAVQAWLHPPPSEKECHCGGELESAYASGGGCSTYTCLKCRRVYFKR